MSLRETLMETLDCVQEVLDNDALDLDIRPNAVAIVTRTWSTHIGLGTPVESATTIDPRPRVLEQAGGRELLVQPVRPSHTRKDGIIGGYTAAQLNPATTATTESFYRVTGPNAGDYDLTDFDSSKPFRYILTLRLRDRRHPTPIG